MPFFPFHTHFPDLAAERTRRILVSTAGPASLPMGRYDFVEHYCADRGCDCRRVIFAVLSSSQRCQIALLNWGWEPLEFYRKDYDFLRESELLDLKGPSILPMAPQTELAAPALGQLVRLLQQDVDWPVHILQHYQMFRNFIDKPATSLKKKASGNRKRRGRR